MKNPAKVTTVHVYGYTYIILKDEQGYWGIDSKLFDSDGILRKRVNGMQGNLSKTLADCVEQCRISAKIEALIRDEGFDRMEAIDYLVTLLDIEEALEV